MAILRKAMGALVGLIAAYAFKKLVTSIEAQADKIRETPPGTDPGVPRDTKDMKQLKQDPVTGVYYAED